MRQPATPVSRRVRAARSGAATAQEIIVISPWRIDHECSKPALARLQAEHSGFVAGTAQRSIGAIDATITIKLLSKRAVPSRLSFRGLAYGFDFLNRAPRYASKGAELVAGLALQGVENFHTLGTIAHPRLGRGLLDRLQRSADCIDLGRQEILAVSVLGELAAHHCIEIDDGGGESLSSRAPWRRAADVHPRLAYRPAGRRRAATTPARPMLAASVAMSPMSPRRWRFPTRMSPSGRLVATRLGVLRITTRPPTGVCD